MTDPAPTADAAPTGGVAPRRAVASAPRRDATATGSTEPQDGSEMRRRGRLIMPEKVIEKIAGQAAAEIGAARGRSGGVLGVGSEPDPAARPKVDVDLSTDSADLAIAVGIAYPQSIRQTTQQIRDHVVARVGALTGVHVHRVDIDVTFLSVDADQGHGIDHNLDHDVDDGSAALDSHRRKDLR